MAKVFCPKCGGAGLTIESDGYLRCDRTVLVADTPLGEHRAPCGYRGFEAQIELDPSKRVEVILGSTLRVSMLDGLSVDGADLEEPVPEMAEGHALVDSPYVKTSSWTCINIYCDFRCPISLDIDTAKRRHAAYLAEHPATPDPACARCGHEAEAHEPHSTRLHGAGCQVGLPPGFGAHPDRCPCTSYELPASALLPDEGDEPVPTSPIVRARLEGVAEGLYAALHGVTPEDLTVGPGRTEAHEQFLPALRGVADTAWREGYDARSRDLDFDPTDEHAQPRSPYGGGF